ncbi:Putative flagellar motility protein [hydrothermal vent metagenome]|uniref:Putative flagellar motility protein n=1 Tax=hydrothermal vent metagenome TaxID=652676 RepID=A0A1W1CNK5_9ZZZZ
MNKFINGVFLGSTGALMMSVLTGCEAPQEEKQNRFLTIEKQANGKYIVIAEEPINGPSRAIIRETDANGIVTERFMNEAEMKMLAEQEYKKVQDGSSETLRDNGGGAGMGLAGTILAVAAGSLMGNMIGNALMGNKNFSKNSARSNKSAYSRSAAGKASKSGNGKKSFFGGGSKSSSSSKSGGFFGG